MKKILVVLITVMFSSSMLVGQSVEFDSRLLAKYSIEELNKIEKEDPSEIKFLTFCLDNAFYIGDYPTEKDGKMNLDGEKEIADINKINLYDLNIEILDGRNQLFSVNGKSKLLIIYDSKFLEDKFSKTNK